MQLDPPLAGVSLAPIYAASANARASPEGAGARVGISKKQRSRYETKEGSVKWPP